MSNQFICFNPHTDEVLYRASTFSQAVGFADASFYPVSIASTLPASPPAAMFYRLNVINRKTGEVIVRGPVDLLYDAIDVMSELAIVLIPELEYPMESAVPE